MKKQEINKVVRGTQKAQQSGPFGGKQLCRFCGQSRIKNNPLKLYSLHCYRTEGIIDFRKI